MRNVNESPWRKIASREGKGIGSVASCVCCANQQTGERNTHEGRERKVETPRVSALGFFFITWRGGNVKKWRGRGKAGQGTAIPRSGASSQGGVKIELFQTVPFANGA